MIDKVTIYAVEQALKPGFPTDAEAVLIVEVDGLEEGLEEEAGIRRTAERGRSQRSQTCP